MGNNPGKTTELFNKSQRDREAGNSHWPEKIFLVRHGKSIWNGTRRVSGQSDPPLSPKGRTQTAALARFLAAEPLTAIYTSDLSRAIETARPTAEEHGLTINPIRDLREVHMGILQGRFRDERDPEAQHLWSLRKKDKMNYRIAGGENYFDLKTRVVPSLLSILEKEAGGTLLIVGHRNTNRVILEVLLGLTPEQAIEINAKNGYIHKIVPGRPQEVQTYKIETGKLKKMEGFIR
ncbi:MAG: histidine phosphatase family protein [Nitrospinaceae bacterium]